jgi:cytochrome c-type biogenesis protein CcmH/NrfF
MRGLRVAFLAMVIAVGQATAQGPSEQDAAVIETQASQIFNTVMSPFCPGRLIANCPSSAAADLQEEIRGRLAAGATVDEIKNALYDTYGDEIRSAPEARGFGLLAWVIPGAFFVVVGVLVTLWIRSTARAGAVDAVSDARELDAESEAMLAEELSKVAD